MRPRNPGVVGTVEHPSDLAEMEFGDQEVAVGRPAATTAPTRQQVGRVGDERDLAAVGVHRRRVRRAVAGLGDTDLDDTGIHSRHDRQVGPTCALVEDAVAVGVAIEPVHLLRAVGPADEVGRARACDRAT